MRFAREKRWMLGLLALLAPLPLPLNGVIGWPSLTAFWLATALFLVRVASATYRPLRLWAMNLLGLLYIPVLVVEMSTWWQGQQLMRSLTHLILFALVVKLFSLRRERDYWHVLVAVFVLFLAAMGTSVHPAVTLYLLTFLFGGVLVLARFTAFGALAEHGVAGSLERLGLGRFVLSVGLAVLLAAVPMFALLPRLKQPYLFGPGLGSAGEAAGGGFTGGLELDTIGSVRSGRSVVLRFTTEGREIDPSGMRFKSATYDLFRRNTWVRGQRVATERRREPDGFFRLADGATGLWLQVWQSRAGGSRLLLPTDTAAFDVRAPLVVVDDSGVVSLPNAPSATFDYKVGLRRPGARSSLDASPVSRLDLDDSAITPRMRELAAEVMGEGGARDRVERLESYLMREHTYTLDLGSRDRTNPVEDFLFRSRSGHCEYFATSMVLLLRSQGIPARMVSGYLGAEPNPLEGYFIVRQSNAHAWVEARVEGEGWRIFDPTPPAGRPQAASGGVWQLLTQAYDYVLFRWDRYVLTYGLLDQLDFIVRARNFLRELRDRFGGEEPPLPAAEETHETALEAGELASPVWQWGLTTVVALLGILGLWRARAPWSATRAYRALRSDVGRLDADHGARDAATLAPLEVERRVAASCPAAAAEARRIVRLYLEESFAERRLSDGELAELRGAVGAVRKALRKAA